MSYIDTIISYSRLVERRIKLSTCSGLERHLLDELNVLSLKFDLVSREKSNIDISASLDTIWSIIRNSRICNQVYMHVCDPFLSEYVCWFRHYLLRTTKQFVNKLNLADWASFIPFSHKLPAPSIKVTSHNSKLYHTGMIQNMLENVINSHCYKYKKMQRDELPEFMKKRGYVPMCPKIVVDINNDSCQVLADASGDMSERPWHKLSLIDDRIIPIASAAVIQELVSRNVFTKPIVWDPFCHNGSLLLELFSYLKDEKLRIESSNYPLNNFPLCTLFYDHNHISRRKMLYTRNDNNKFTLIGTDPDYDNIKSANEILDKLQDVENENSKLPFDEDPDETTGSPNTTVDLKFECKRISDVSINLNDVVILSNLYYGNKQMKSQYNNYYKEFSKFVKSVRSKCNSIYIIAPKSFKTVSRLNCETLLIFNNKGIIVELMKLS